MKEVRPQRHRLEEVSGVGRNDILDVVGVVEEVSRNVEKACPHDIAVISAASDEAQRVAIKLGHHTQNWVALGTRWKSLTKRLGLP